MTRERNRIGLLRVRRRIENESPLVALVRTVQVVVKYKPRPHTVDNSMGLVQTYTRH